MELKYTEHLKFNDVYPDEAGKLAQRLGIKKDEIPLYRKYYVEEVKDDDISIKNRTITSRISCSSKDRDGESLDPRGVRLKNYRDNPIVCWGHSYGDVKHFIGKNVWIKEEKDGNGLIAETVFRDTQFADDVFKAYTEDVGGTGPLLKGWSVGFIPHAWDDAETKDVEDGAPIRTYTDWELLEYSCVGIPCSPESLTLAHEKGIISKGFKDKITKDYDIEFEVEDDEEVEIESDKPGMKFKERWNKSLSKIFDVENVQSTPSLFEYALLEKFLECKTRDIFQNNHFIPSPLIGTELSGIKEILSRNKLKDTRNFNYDGAESPPQYEVIQLSSTESGDFLIQGTAFYDVDNIPLAVKFSPTWGGLDVSFSTNRKNLKWNKGLLEKALKFADDNNKLKGEKFALNGAFLNRTDDGWDNLILEADSKDSIKKSANQLIRKGEDCPGRGLLFVGNPGTGKTKTGRVLSNEVDSTFIWVSSKDFLRCDPIAALSLAFNMARKLSPSILFLEDIDTWIGDYTVDLLKTELDGIRQNKGIISILTSNFPEKLPDALLDRPGRFHHVIDFVLPGKEERREMLSKWAGEIKADLLEDILKKTVDFSGSHMQELVEFAKMIVEEDAVEMGIALMKSLEKMMAQKELIEQIRDNKKGYKSFLTKVRDMKQGDIGSTLKVAVDYSTEFKMVIQLMQEQNEALTELVKKLSPEEEKDIDIEIEDDNPDIDIEPDESREPKKSEQPKGDVDQLAEDVRARLMGKVG